MIIKQDFIPETNANRPRIKMTPRFITVHETANRRNGANAQMHARYVKNPTTPVSWHYTVDNHEMVFQHLPVDEIGWHAGDGGSGRGNRESIGIEICVNSDGDFIKAMENAIALIRFLMKEHSIPLGQVVPHQYWTGKNCPATLLKTWDFFKESLKNSVETDVRIETQIEGKNSTTHPTSFLLKKGSQGEAVRQLQENLIKVGELHHHFVASGHFDLETERAVRSFQKKAELKVDGMVGSLTQVALKEILKKQPQPTPKKQKFTKKNMSEKDVRYIQFVVGAKVDGVFGKETEEKVKVYQKKHGLTVDGIVGPKTWSKMDQLAKKTVYKRPLSLKSPYMDGEDIKMVQAYLGVIMDGLYGPNTERAVRHYQAKHNLMVDGIVGPKTWTQLFS
ncbi:N-acetylmuramoyl-L-alanine amidase [Bacillus sp. TS-2]|nr:N-acetylmuramoyl-L-alanine amidase [Bacillus sp. TS-2]